MSAYNQGGENALLLRFRRLGQTGIMSEKENQIVVYQPNETVRLDVRLENETVWLTQLKIAELFGVQKAAISKHIRNIYASGELIREATVSKMETVQIEGGRTLGPQIVTDFH